jgi:hypothetical protein
MVGLLAADGVDEFLRWDSEDGYRYELGDGEARALAPANTFHGFLQNALGRLIGNHMRDEAPGCEVVANPDIVPRLLSEHNVRIPSIAVTCAPLAAGQATLPDPVLLGFKVALADLYAGLGPRGEPQSESTTGVTNPRGMKPYATALRRTAGVRASVRHPTFLLPRAFAGTTNKLGISRRPTLAAAVAGFGVLPI